MRLTIKRHLVSLVVVQADRPSPDSAPHFLPPINRINVLKSNFRAKLPGWKINRRQLSLLKVSRVLLRTSSDRLFLYLSITFWSHKSKCELSAVT